MLRLGVVVGAPNVASIAAICCRSIFGCWAGYLEKNPEHEVWIGPSIHQPQMSTEPIRYSVLLGCGEEQLGSKGVGFGLWLSWMELGFAARW